MAWGPDRGHGVGLSASVCPNYFDLGRETTNGLLEKTGLASRGSSRNSSKQGADLWPRNPYTEIDDRMMVIETVLSGPPEKNKNKKGGHGGGGGHGLHSSSSLPNFRESRRDRLLRDCRVRSTLCAAVNGLRTPGSSRPGTGHSLMREENVNLQSSNLIAASEEIPFSMMRYAAHPPTKSDPCRYASSIYRPITTPDNGGKGLRSRSLGPDDAAPDMPQYYGGLSKYAAHPGNRSDACRYAGNLYRPLPGIQVMKSGRASCIEPQVIPHDRK